MMSTKQQLLLLLLLALNNLNTCSITVAFVGSSPNRRVQSYKCNNVIHGPTKTIPTSKTSPSRLSYHTNRDHQHEIRATKRMREAELVEETLSTSLHEARVIHYNDRRDTSCAPLLFPCVRQCNAAIASFGDDGDFRRALKLFTDMRKSASIIRRISRSGTNSLAQQAQVVDIDDGALLEEEEHGNKRSSVDSYSPDLIDMVRDPPAPTLVTYSTLISRAVSVGKPRVAIRLWNLMKNQPTFYTNVISRKQRQGRISDPTVFLDSAQLRKLEAEHDAIVPDVIFCNTLMNAYAKLGDHKMARFILNSMLGTEKQVLHEIPRVVPTIISFNTLADACKEAGDLAAGLEVLELMKSHAQDTGDESIAPDARTYTILISTVARKIKQQEVTRDVRSGGERDPDKAFQLLSEMQEEGIKPNGVTYCALIDVCGRCRRADLALNGLRLMLSENKSTNSTKSQVGAWTAAITACGKNGRIDTALRLFVSMQRQFSIKPNVVTCGSLTDSLVKAGRIEEALGVLKYMKDEDIFPGEVMYTSLMSSALEMAQRNNDQVLVDGVEVKVIDRLVSSDRGISDSRNTTNSILLYTELMRSMVRAGRDASSEDVLLKVFLTFQEMKVAGVKPDLACYNSLLRACSFAGDSVRALDVLRRIDEDGLQPNDVSYREVLKAAAKEGNSGVCEHVWDEAVSRKRGQYDIDFSPRASDFELLATSYWGDIQKTTNHTVRLYFHTKLLNVYEDVQTQSQKRGMHFIDLKEIEQNQNIMLLLLRSAVSIVLTPRKSDKDANEHEQNVRERVRARSVAIEIAEIFDGMHKSRLSTVDGKTKKALALARDWMLSD